MDDSFRDVNTNLIWVKSQYKHMLINELNDFELIEAIELYTKSSNNLNRIKMGDLLTKQLNLLMNEHIKRNVNNV